MTTQTKYARSGNTSIAYQVMGGGNLDLVFVPGFMSNLEHMHLEPRVVQAFGRLSLITFDKRGTGLSDRTAGIATLEERMDDVRAVMDAVGSERAALFGISEGGPMSLLFAATYPERTTALVLYGSFARTAWAEDYPWGRRIEEHRARLTAMRDAWETGMTTDRYAPGLAEDQAFRHWWATLERMSASPLQR